MEQKRIEEALGSLSEPFEKEFYKITGYKASQLYWPVTTKEKWWCSCGCENTLPNKTCDQCGISLNDLAKMLKKEHLQQLKNSNSSAPVNSVPPAESTSNTEKSIKKQEKKDITKIILIISVILLACWCAVLTTLYILQNNSEKEYRQEQQPYMEAIKQLIEAGQNSAQQSKDASLCDNVAATVNIALANSGIFDLSETITIDIKDGTLSIDGLGKDEKESFLEELRNALDVSTNEEYYDETAGKLSSSDAAGKGMRAEISIDEDYNTNVSVYCIGDPTITSNEY